MKTIKTCSIYTKEQSVKPSCTSTRGEEPQTEAYLSKLGSNTCRHNLVLACNCHAEGSRREVPPGCGRTQGVFTPQ